MLIKSAIRAVGRIWRHPSYVINVVRFIQWQVGTSLHGKCSRHDIRAPRAKPFKTLLVALRTSDFVQHCSPASRGLEEYGIRDKYDVIKCCGASFVKAVRVFREHYGDAAIRIALIEDRLSEKGRAVYQGAAPFDEMPSSPGNRETFLAQVEVARQADDDTLVCFLEDDYLLDPNAFCEAFELFNKSSIAGFTPHFHPGLCNHGAKVELFFFNGKFYAHVPSTTCTFFISATDVRKNLTRLQRYYGSELGCINEIWRDSICLAPCCRTLAEHMHKQDLSLVWHGIN